MIVFAHGYDVTPDTYSPLLDEWVRAGFVVVAPIFPGENPREVAAQHGANTEQDLLNEPADLAFVTRRVLLATRGRLPGCPLPSTLIRRDALALAGQSDGAEVVGILSYSLGSDPQGVSYQSLRKHLDFRATLVLSGQEDGIDPYGAPRSAPALLQVQSLADQCNTPQDAERLYRAVDERAKWFLELKSAHHLPPFDGVDVPAFDLVTASSLRFLEITLVHTGTVKALMAIGNSDPTVGAIFRGGDGPTLPPYVPTSLPCGPN